MKSNNVFFAHTHTHLYNYIYFYFSSTVNANYTVHNKTSGFCISYTYTLSTNLKNNLHSI